MNILVENSTWNNVGDGFYQYSLFYILKTLFPRYNIQMLDGPIVRAFRPNRWFRKNALDLMYAQEGDIYVFSGPILNKDFVGIYGPKIKKIAENGKHHLILSAHSPTERSIVEMNRCFMKQYPPLAFSSRDRDTYKLYSDIAKTAYDGVCAAFFVSRVLPVPDIAFERKYITLSVCNGLEPSLSIKSEPLWDGNIEKATIEISEKRAMCWRVSRHFEWLTTTHQSVLGDFVVVRPQHDISYYWSHLNFVRPNSFLSYNPLSYLSVYRGTSLTISNRVHACVVTLSFGKPVMFLGRTERSSVFERVDLAYQGNRIMRLREDIIDKEYDGFVRWLESAVENV